MARNYSDTRYTYIKTSNVVEELRRIDSMHSRILSGGPEAYVANFLRVAGDAPALLISFHSSPKTNDVLIQNNIEARSFYWPHGFSLPTLVLRIVLSLKLFLRLMRFRPTHILCWQSNWPLWVTYLAARLNGATFVPSRHTRFPNKDDPWYRQLTGTVDKWMLKRSPAIVCHGPYLAQHLLKCGMNSSQVLEFNWSFQHMVDNAVCPGEAPDLTAGGKFTIILFVGRMISLKGVFDLLDACKTVLSRKSMVKLAYAGGGPDLTKLKTYAVGLGLVDQVVFLGRVKHEKLGAIIRQSKVVVTPTQSKYPEGRCMAVIEGLIFGVPVIAPDFGPFPYLIKHRINGLLYEADAVNALTASIDAVLEDNALYKRLKGGAKRSGATLLNPPVTFRQAVESAFRAEHAP